MLKVFVFHLMPWPFLKEELAWPYPNRLFDPTQGQRLYQEYIDELVLAEELGYDAICFNEHHFTAYGLMPSPNLIVSALAVKTKKIRLAIFGNAIPLRGQPLRVAEEIAMIDVLSGGRVISGFVRGIPSEYFAYNINPGESRPRFQEAWDFIVKAWTEEEPFDWDGKFWKYKNVSIWPRPLQKPHPPLWMPAESSESIEYAATKRVPVSRVYVPTADMKESFDYYRDFAQKIGWTPTPDYFMPLRHIYVAETMEQARRESEKHLEYFYKYLVSGTYRSPIRQAAEAQGYRTEKSYAYSTQAKVDKGARYANFTFEEFQKAGDIIVGDPSYVADEIKQQKKELGANTILGFFQFGSMPHDLVVKNLKLFSQEVLPKVHNL